MSDGNGFGSDSKIAILEVWLKEKQFLNSAISATSPGSNIGTKTQRLCT